MYKWEGSMAASFASKVIYCNVSGICFSPLSYKIIFLWGKSRDSIKIVKSKSLLKMHPIIGKRKKPNCVQNNWITNDFDRYSNISDSCNNRKGGEKNCNIVTFVSVRDWLCGLSACQCPWRMVRARGMGWESVTSQGVVALGVLCCWCKAA